MLSGLRHAEKTIVCGGLSKFHREADRLSAADGHMVMQMQRWALDSIHAQPTQDESGKDDLHARRLRMMPTEATAGTCWQGPGVGGFIVQTSMELPRLPGSEVRYERLRPLAFLGLWLEAKPTPHWQPGEELTVTASDYAGFIGWTIRGLSLSRWSEPLIVPPIDTEVDQSDLQGLRSRMVEMVARSRSTTDLLRRASLSRRLPLEPALELLAEEYLLPAATSVGCLEAGETSAMVATILDRIREDFRRNRGPREMNLIIAITQAGQSEHAHQWRSAGIDLRLVAGRVLEDRRLRWDE